MGRYLEQGQSQRDQGGPICTHVERPGDQLGEKAAIPRLDDQGVEARLRHAD